MPYWKCPKCDNGFNVAKVVYPVHCACGFKDVGDLPSTMVKLARFTVAAVKHIANGAPTASDELIEERLNICKGCEFYTGYSCRKCGCTINSKKLVSKVAWEDSKCPVGKW